MIGHPNCVLNIPYSESTGTVASDLSKSGFNATLIGGQSRVMAQAGIGVSNTNATQNIQIGNNLSFSIGTPFTIVVTMKTTSTAYQPIFSKIQGSSSYRGYDFYVSNTNVGLELVSTNPLYQKTGTGAVGASLVDGLFHTIAVTYDGTNNAFASCVKLYVDGKQLTITTISDGSIAAGFDNTVSAYTSGRFGMGYGIIGTLDDTKVFDIVLPISDIKRIMIGLHPLSRS